MLSVRGFCAALDWLPKATLFFEGLNLRIFFFCAANYKEQIATFSTKTMTTWSQCTTYAPHLDWLNTLRESSDESFFFFVADILKQV